MNRTDKNEVVHFLTDAQDCWAAAAQQKQQLLPQSCIAKCALYMLTAAAAQLELSHKSCCWMFPLQCIIVDCTWKYAAYTAPWVLGTKAKDAFNKAKHGF